MSAFFPAGAPVSSFSNKPVRNGFPDCHISSRQLPKSSPDRYLRLLARFVLKGIALRWKQNAAVKSKRDQRTSRRKEKGEAAMRSSLLRTTVIMVLLSVILVPGLLQAKSPAHGWTRASRPAGIEQGFFSVVWNLLTDLWESGAGFGSDGSIFVKNGGMMDPNGGTPPPPPSGDTATGDNGGMMDPNG
jgi:hypothetical protein